MQKFFKFTKVLTAIWVIGFSVVGTLVLAENTGSINRFWEYHSDDMRDLNKHLEVLRAEDARLRELIADDHSSIQGLSESNGRNIRTIDETRVVIDRLTARSQDGIEADKRMDADIKSLVEINKDLVSQIEKMKAEHADQVRQLTAIIGAVGHQEPGSYNKEMVFFSVLGGLVFAALGTAFGPELIDRFREWRVNRSLNRSMATARGWETL
jgi:hypothetical protein